MKKLFISTLLILFVSSTVFAEAFNTKQEEILWIPNPWVECNDNFSCGIKTARFNFPLSLSNYTIRATKGIFEISYPLDDSRTVTVRKSFDEANNGDNSGDYTKYPINNTLELKDGVIVNTRRDEKLIYVTHFCAESGCFSIRSPQGLTEKEVQEIFSMISEAESPKFEEE